MMLTSRKNVWKKIFIFPLCYYTNCVSTTQTVLILRNVESVYFFYSNSVLKTLPVAFVRAISSFFWGGGSIFATNIISVLEFSSIYVFAVDFADKKCVS